MGYNCHISSDTTNHEVVQPIIVIPFWRLAPGQMVPFPIKQSEGCSSGVDTAFNKTL